MEWLIPMVNVGKYTSPMDAMGMFSLVNCHTPPPTKRRKSLRKWSSFFSKAEAKRAAPRSPTWGPLFFDWNSGLEIGGVGSLQKSRYIEVIWVPGIYIYIAYNLYIWGNHTYRYTYKGYFCRKLGLVNFPSHSNIWLGHVAGVQKPAASPWSLAYLPTNPTFKTWV